MKSAALGAAMLRSATVRERMYAVLSHEMARLAGVIRRADCFLRTGDGR